jgi:hypothetical protein
MKTLVLSVLMLLPSLGQAALENWHPINEKLFKSFVVLNVVDTFQTFNLIDCQDNLAEQCPYLEGNKVLGTHPSKAEVLLIKALLIGGSYYLLDKSYGTPQWANSNKPKFVALVIMNMVYIDTVSKNHSIGLRLSYHF